MRYPTLPVQHTTQEMVDVFLGYNHNLRIGDGEFYDMKNLSSNQFPILTPRGARGIYAQPTTGVTGLIGKEAPCYVDGESIVIDQVPVNLGLNSEPKQLVSMGAYVVIFPDKKYINTAPGKHSDNGYLEATATTSGKITFEMCKLTGEAYEVPPENKKDTAPTEPNDGDMWIDTSTTPNSLKQFSADSGNSGKWVPIASTYIKISAVGIGVGFKKGDGVNISGLKDVELKNFEDNETVLDEDITAIDGAFVLQDCQNDYIIIIGILKTYRELSNAVTLERKLPEMDFIIESGNRLWGCRYGEDNKGEFVNQIYASKLGDFKNWTCYQGISTSSYCFDLGSDGPFTGAIAHLGYPLFFKDNCMHMVYGSPGNNQIQTTTCRGVQKGSHKSMAIVNEVLYYKSRQGVCAYDGSLPTEISAPLGEVMYSNAVGGAYANKYYISMADNSGKYHLFVYDTAKKLWHKEDNTQVDAFCSCGNELFFLDHADGIIKTAFGSGELCTTPVEWMAETGVIGANVVGKKYLSRLNIQLILEIGARVNFFVQYDSMGDFEYVCTLAGTSLRSFSVPIRPNRCDHLRLRIEGKGNAKIFYICKTFEQGSDI